MTLYLMEIQKIHAQLFIFTTQMTSIHVIHFAKNSMGDQEKPFETGAPDVLQVNPPFSDPARIAKTAY
jgi:hypothetical protein